MASHWIPHTSIHAHWTCTRPPKLKGHVWLQTWQSILSTSDRLIIYCTKHKQNYHAAMVDASKHIYHLLQDEGLFFIGSTHIHTSIHRHTHTNQYTPIRTQLSSPSGSSLPYSSKNNVAAAAGTQETAAVSSGVTIPLKSKHTHHIESVNVNVNVNTMPATINL